MIAPVSRVIRAGKILDYLLNEHHVRGGAKAKFFFSFGYSPANSEMLVAGLLAHAQSANFVSEGLTPEGKRKLVFEGEIQAPDGRRPWIRTVWQIDDAGQAIFVTAVPMRGRFGTS